MSGFVIVRFKNKGKGRILTDYKGDFQERCRTRQTLLGLFPIFELSRVNGGCIIIYIFN